MAHATAAARRAYDQAYRARLHAQGRCTDCRGGPVAPGHVLCDDCRYAQRLYRAAHYERTRRQWVRQPPAPRQSWQHPPWRVLWMAEVRRT
jgi:hypothetical protein